MKRYVSYALSRHSSRTTSTFQILKYLHTLLMKKVELIGEKFHFYYQPILTSCECSKHVNYALDILVTMLYNF